MPFSISPVAAEFRYAAALVAILLLADGAGCSRSEPAPPATGAAQPSSSDLVVGGTNTSSPSPAVDTSHTSDDDKVPLSVIGTKMFAEPYPEDGTVKRRWQVKLFSNYTPENPVAGSWTNHGPFVEYYHGPQQVKFSEGSYTDGKIDGQWTYWHPNGQVAKQGSYILGHLDGPWKYYREDGTLEYMESYSHGLEDGQWIYYAVDGKTRIEQRQYLAGKPEGTWTTWYDAEHKKSEETYKNGVLEGARHLWFANGQMSQEEHYLAGKPHGLFRSWDEKGTQLGQAEFENGRRKPRGTAAESPSPTASSTKSPS